MDKKKMVAEIDEALGREPSIAIPDDAVTVEAYAQAESVSESSAGVILRKGWRAGKLERSKRNKKLYYWVKDEMSPRELGD